MHFRKPGNHMSQKKLRRLHPFLFCAFYFAAKKPLLIQFLSIVFLPQYSTLQFSLPHHRSILFFPELEYAVVRKSAKMIGSLFLLNRSCPTMKQRTTGVIFGGKLILYHNGRKPKTPLLLLDLEASMIIEGIEANCRFCIIDGSQTKHEFEALDEEERAEWVTELLKQQEMPDYEDEEIHPPINVYPSGEFISF